MARSPETLLKTSIFFGKVIECRTFIILDKHPEGWGHWDSEVLVILNHVSANHSSNEIVAFFLTFRLVRQSFSSRMDGDGPGWYIENKTIYMVDGKSTKEYSGLPDEGGVRGNKDWGMWEAYVQGKIDGYLSYNRNLSATFNDLIEKSRER